MITDWILVVVFTASGFTGAFSSEDACEAAKKQVLERQPYASAVCYENQWH